jgi:acyl-coenzyme A thioesterase PaaI-like protein
MTEAAQRGDIRRAWLDEEEAGLSAARVAKHRLVEQVRRLVDAAFQLDCGDAGYDSTYAHEAADADGGHDAAGGGNDAADATGETDKRDADRAARFLALAAEAEALADRLDALPHVPRADVGGVNSSRARRHDALLVERSTINGRGNPLAPPVRMWADGDLVRAEAYFTAPYEGPPGRVHGAWMAACFDEILGCAQGASGAFGFTGTLTITLRRATPLYTKITYEAGFSHREGRKIHAWGRCYADGKLTAEASGVFVVPVFGAIGHGAAG